MSSHEPGGQNDVGEIADVIVMMMCDEDQVHLIERHTGADHLQHDASTGVEQKIFVADLKHGGWAMPLRVRPGSTGSQQGNFHS